MRNEKLRVIRPDMVIPPELGFAVEHFPKFIHRQPRPHSVSVVLVTFIVRGKGQHILGNDQYEETGSSLAVTHYGQVHDILTGPEGMEIYNLYLELDRKPLPPLPSEFDRILPAILPLHPRFQNRLNRRVRVEVPDPEPLALLFARLRDELAERGPGWDEAARCCFRLILMSFARLAMQGGVVPMVATPNSPEQWLEAVRGIIDQNPAEPHTLASLAERAGVHPDHLSRQFPRYAGKRLFDYLNERRVQDAMVRLRNSADRVTDIALDSGFNDLSHFNRQFKKLVGLTPSAYRAGTSSRPE